MSVRDLPMALVRRNPDQPRKHFDAATLAELAASIEENGLIQAIRVRADGAGGYLIVAGERRWRAHRLTEAETIRAEVVDEMTDRELDLQAIIENMHRDDVSPLEEAKAFQRLLEQGMTVDELAKSLGMRQPWRVTERTNLLRLDPVHQEALSKGILTPSQAYEMSRLCHTNQRVLFEAIRAGRCKGYNELRATAAALLASEQQTGLFGTESPEEKQKRERKAEQLRQLERRIDRVTELLQAGFDDNEVVILAKVNRENSGVLADKLELMEQQLCKLRLALRAANVAVKAA